MAVTADVACIVIAIGGWVFELAQHKIGAGIVFAPPAYVAVAYFDDRVLEVGKIVKDDLGVLAEVIGEKIDDRDIRLQKLGQDKIPFEN